jgi:hypothetical protein
MEGRDFAGVALEDDIGGEKGANELRTRSTDEIIVFFNKELFDLLQHLPFSIARPSSLCGGRPPCSHIRDLGSSSKGELLDEHRAACDLPGHHRSQRRKVREAPESANALTEGGVRVTEEEGDGEDGRGGVKRIARGRGESLRRGRDDEFGKNL